MTNELCNLCNEQKETKIHAFLECKHIKSFLLEIEDWISNIKNSKTHKSNTSFDLNQTF